MPAGRRIFIAVPVVTALLSSVGGSPTLARGWAPGMPASAARAHAQYFAGRSYPEAGAATVTTLFIVPRMTCTNTNTGVAAGAFLYTTTKGSGRTASKSDVSGASVQLFCLRSEPAPLPVVEVEGQQVYGRKRPHAGDLMKATIIDSSRVLGVTLQDLTKHHEFTLTRTTTAAPATAAAIGEDALKGVPSLTPGPVYPITDFGSIQFGAARVNGRLLGAAGGRAFDMASSTRVLQIRTGPLTGGHRRKARSAFTTVWRHS